MNSTDLVAKLLAQENLTVIRTNNYTASFDVGTRVLALPLWKNITNEIESLMVLHEVGHALFTTGDTWIKAIEEFEPKQRGVLKGYFNVVEDARIEKLIKRRFPGSRKTFFTGYNQLVERDFFKLKGRDVNSMLLIDRINLYFKGGVQLGIKFDAEEKSFINRIDNCETIDEMITIAVELYEFSKTRMEARKSELNFDELDYEDEDVTVEVDYDFDDGYGDDYDSGSEEGDDFDDEDDEGEDTDEKGNGGVREEDLESKTDKALQDSMEELADSSTEYRYYEFSNAFMQDPIIPFKKIIKETAEVEEWIRKDREEEGRDHVKDFDKFMTESERMVNYLVKEFEMRKSAAAYRRAQVSKSGSLNMSKLHAYKLTDDIFRRITTVPNGKNHGMVFLLDWSGSMDQVIAPTIKQVINLAMFCRRVNIPYEVYAFSGSYTEALDEDVEGNYYRRRHFISALNEVKDKNIMYSDQSFNLLNLFSSKMTNLEFKTMARRLTNYKFRWVKGYGLGDTPLNDALLYMLDYVPKFKRMNNLDKLALITLTDGEGGNLYTNQRMLNVNYTDDGKVKVKNFFKDPITQKLYEANSYSSGTTQTLLSMIKDRYDISVLGFYICPNRRGSLSSAYSCNAGQSADESIIQAMRSQFNEKGFYSLMGTGRDELFIVPDTSTKIKDEEIMVDGDMTAAAIARKLTKTMTNKKTSRILLDRFIGYVA